MKVKLVVAQGVHSGREIPLAGPEFAIGRDPQCQLRPSSPAISKKHCAVIVRGNKVFVRDYGSTNGTFVNGEGVKGEVEVADQANLKVGPLEFTISIAAAPPPAPEPVAAAPAKKPASGEDEDFAAFLLDGDGPAGSAPPVPEGSTIMEMGVARPDPEAPKKEEKPDAKKTVADTQKAADEILKRYNRRPRS